MFKLSVFSIIILFFTFTEISAETFSDTTVTIKPTLEKGKESIPVSCIFNDSTQAFTLKIGNDAASGIFQDAFGIDLQLLDIDGNSSNNVLAVIGNGPDDDNEYYFYEYVNGKIIPCGHIDYANGVNTQGDKILKAEKWMGFWTVTEDYYFDDNSKTLVKKPKEFYTLEADGKVTHKFNLLKDRSDDSAVSGSLKTGTKIKVVKADISPTCKDADGNDDSFRCHWYFIQSADGTEGWARLKDFMENVEGLPWAG